MVREWYDVGSRMVRSLKYDAKIIVQVWWENGKRIVR